jgi:hypothetical protein
MSSSLPELVLRLPSLAALRAELPNLEKRRAFVPEAGGVEMRQGCQLVLVHPDGGNRLSIRAEVVWVQTEGPGKGVGVELRELEVERLRAFVESSAGQPPPALDEAPDAAPDDASGSAKGLYERIRSLSTRERETCARSGALTERVALERCYGTSVWEGLLQNPQITPPEVARIARNGTVPVPLLGLIVANSGWLSVGEVQRALLSNPRASGSQIDRILGALSPSDLRRISQQTAYRAPVRQAAQKLLKR